MRYNALRPLQRTATRSDTGDAAGALKAYKRCIEIDPANSAAKGELQRLELDQVIFWVSRQHAATHCYCAYMSVLGHTHTRVTATHFNAALQHSHRITSVCMPASSHTHTSNYNTLQYSTATQSWNDFCMHARIVTHTHESPQHAATQHCNTVIIE